MNDDVGNMLKEPAVAKHGTRLLPRHVLRETEETTKKLRLANLLGRGLNTPPPAKEIEQVPTRKRRPSRMIVQWFWWGKLKESDH